MINVNDVLLLVAILFSVVSGFTTIVLFTKQEQRLNEILDLCKDILNDDKGITSLNKELIDILNKLIKREDDDRR